MKKLLYAGIVIPFLFSCNGNSSTNTTKSDSTSSMMSTDSSNNKMDHTASGTVDTLKNTTPAAVAITDKDVTDFAKKASEGSLMEVQLGNIAATNAQSQRVKNFAAMIVTDHTAALNEINGMAKSNSITVPAELGGDTKKHVDMLGMKTGAAFDKDYISMMVDDHKKDIAEFKKAAGNLKEDSYKNFAAKTLPTLQKHLDSAQAIIKNLK